MKKYVMATLLLALMAGGAFTLDITAGLMVNTFNGTRNTYRDYDNGEYKESGAGVGLYGSAGWKYADINLAIFWYNANMSAPLSNFNFASFSSLVFQAGAYAKLPFNIATKLRIFPTIGADFAWGINYNEPDDMGLYAGAGVGADLILFRNMFVRANILAGYDFFKPGFGMVFKVGAGWLL